MKINNKYDVVIIGAGVVGCSIARELARWDLDALLLEAGNDIASGATRANSGIVHAGFDPLPNTLKAQFNVSGSKLFPKWANELGFSYKRNGSMVLAFSESELEKLNTLYMRGKTNGVTSLYIVDGNIARNMEPALSKDVRGALVASLGAICDPYEVALKALENAIANGMELKLNSRVKTIVSEYEGYRIDTLSETFYSRCIINAAGINADSIGNQVSRKKRLQITPVKGEYVLYDSNFSSTFSHTIFQVPTSAGKGVLVSPTVHGNLFIGPNSHWQSSKSDFSTTVEGLREIVDKARKSWPCLSMNGIITNFAGLRASCKEGDFVIGPVDGSPGFFDAACIDSPGLSSAPAIAVYLAGLVADYLHAKKREDFNPKNNCAKRFSLMSNKERVLAIKKNPNAGKIICRCCKVTEAEIVKALHGPVPALSLDAVKWRCRATMGRCHGGFCTPAILSIMSRELGVLPESIDKRITGGHVIGAARSDYLSLVGAEAHYHVYGSNDSDSVDRDLNYDVVIIGGGAAGIAAAKAASDEGASVILLDRDSHLGGILKQCIHSGFGLKRYSEELTGPEYAYREITSLDNIKTINDATVLEIQANSDSDSKRVFYVSPAGMGCINTKAVILATGSRERGFGALNIAGDRPAGIFTAGSAQALINLQGCIPGKRAVVLGSGDIGLIMARRMALSKMDVVGVYEISDTPSGLRRNIVQCLDDFGIPLELSSTVTRVEGQGRLSAVWVSKVDPVTKEPISGSEQRIVCDTLVLSVGLIPENELAKELGVQLDAVTGGAEVDDTLQSSVAGVFACGNALHIHDLADYVSEEGDVAGRSAAHYALGYFDLNVIVTSIPVTSESDIRYVVPQKINVPDKCGGETVLSFRVAKVIHRPRFIVEACKKDGSPYVIGRSSTMIAVPAEMQRMKIKLNCLENVVSLKLRVEERV